MSLILDALKKSERERQRDRAPGLQSIHQPPPPREQRSPRAWWWLAAVVVVNAALLGYWRIQPASVTSHAAPSAVPSTPPQSGASAAADPRKPPEPAADNPAANSATSEYTKISPTQTAAAQTPDTQPQPQTSRRIEEVGELPDEVRNNLPAMTFSFHVYSANAQQRTIIINNRRMREGDEISAGLQLQEITEDGVILLSAGHRVHIGVLSGW